MFLGKVVGRVWSTVKHPGLESQRLLIVQPVTPEGAPSGRRVICADSDMISIAGDSLINLDTDEIRRGLHDGSIRIERQPDGA